MLDCESAPENGGDLKQESLRKSQKVYDIAWQSLKVMYSKTRVIQADRKAKPERWKKLEKSFEKRLTKRKTMLNQELVALLDESERLRIEKITERKFWWSLKIWIVRMARVEICKVKQNTCEW